MARLFACVGCTAIAFGEEIPTRGVILGLCKQNYDTIQTLSLEYRMTPGPHVFAANTPVEYPFRLTAPSLTTYNFKREKLQQKIVTRYYGEADASVLRGLETTAYDGSKWMKWHRFAHPREYQLGVDSNGDPLKMADGSINVVIPMSVFSYIDTWKTLLTEPNQDVRFKMVASNESINGRAVVGIDCMQAGHPDPLAGPEEAPPPDKPCFIYWVDIENGSLVRTEVRMQDHGRMTSTTMDITSERFGDTWLPTRIEVTEDNSLGHGKYVIEIVKNSVRLNGEIKDEIFSPEFPPQTRVWDNIEGRAYEIHRNSNAADQQSRETILDALILASKEQAAPTRRGKSGRPAS